MTTEIETLEQEIEKLKEKLAELRHNAPRQEVQNYEFVTSHGSVKLTDLFDGRNELFVIHNMGKKCPYCTLWADGFNGHARHYEDRAAFVVVSPDSPEDQKAFAESRGWTFDMATDATRDFTSAMGFWTEKDGWWPGVSAFVREGDKLYRTGKTVFGPGDDFCGIWPMMDLLGGSNSWEPK